MTTTNAIYNHNLFLDMFGYSILCQLGLNKIENVRIITKAGQPLYII